MRIRIVAIITFFLVASILLSLLKTDPVCTELKRLKESPVEWNQLRFHTIMNVDNGFGCYK